MEDHLKIECKKSKTEEVCKKVTETYPWHEEIGKGREEKNSRITTYKLSPAVDRKDMKCVMKIVKFGVGTTVFI